MKNVQVIWPGGNRQFAISGRSEEDLWKPVGEICGTLVNSPVVQMMTIAVDNTDTAELFVGDGTVKMGKNQIRLPWSCYGKKMLRKIDPASGAHQFYDIIPHQLDVLAKVLPAPCDRVQGLYRRPV